MESNPADFKSLEPIDDLDGVLGASTVDSVQLTKFLSSIDAVPTQPSLHVSDPPGAIIAKLPPTWRSYRKKILHNSEDFSLEKVQKISELSLNLGQEMGMKFLIMELQKPMSWRKTTSPINSTNSRRESPSRTTTNSKKKCSRENAMFVAKLDIKQRIVGTEKKGKIEGKVNSLENDNIVATVSKINVVERKAPG
ncbi:uncharacterized protein Adt_23151 [Abeliophyllum distichum]|uniref:Uncharacterized protein n=1 Tax=Abeliophyllum distichum TaxID=126358 RepID=A0ABD1SA22_9LAMI